jgi:hypothetical protein
MWTLECVRTDRFLLADVFCIVGADGKNLSAGKNTSAG